MPYYVLKGLPKSDLEAMAAWYATAIKISPDDPLILLVQASKAAKADRARSLILLNRALEKGCQEIAPLETRVLAWEVSPSPKTSEALKSYLFENRNEWVVLCALRSRPELAKLAGISISK
jgi:hypothetical protein